jgi:hypothetical protein
MPNRPGKYTLETSEVLLNAVELSLLTGNCQVHGDSERAMMPKPNDIACFTWRKQMLWLIWIAIMLLTPVLAGIGVWRQTHAQPREVRIADVPSDSQLGRST